MQERESINNLRGCLIDFLNAWIQYGSDREMEKNKVDFQRKHKERMENERGGVDFMNHVAIWIDEMHREVAE